MHDRGDVALVKVVDRHCAPDRQPAERGVELVGNARRLLARDRIGQRHRVRDLGHVRRVGRRDEEREEAACEPRPARRLEIHVRRRLAAPPSEHKVVVSVDDHAASSYGPRCSQLGDRNGDRGTDVAEQVGERLDTVRVELGTTVLLQLGERRFRRQPAPVRPPPGHRLERVRDRKHA